MEKMCIRDRDKIMRKYGFHDWNSCLATVGHGGLKEGQIVNRMYEEYKKDHLARITDEEVLETISENKEKVPEKKSKSGIIVKGLYDVAVHFSKCCSPVPGDEIVGFVTRGRGVSIHRTDCINIINLSDMERERLIDAEWQHDEESGNSGLYPVSYTHLDVYKRQDQSGSRHNSIHIKLGKSCSRSQCICHSTTDGSFI